VLVAFLGTSAARPAEAPELLAEEPSAVVPVTGETRLIVERVHGSVTVAKGEAACGILVCGTGLGMCYTANRVRGVRAALCWSVEAARLARDHNDANILILPGRIASLDPAEEILAAFDGAVLRAFPMTRRWAAYVHICGVRK
jgi:hypothetical protein